MAVMRWSAGLLILLGACRFNFDPLVGGGDDDADSGVPMVGDSGVELGPFNTPVQQTALGTARADQGPSLTADLRELYFYSNRDCPSCYDLFVAKRMAVTDAWGTPTPVTELNTASVDVTPEVSPDGLTLWYASERDTPAGGADIWVTTRANRSLPWNPPMRDVNLSTTGYDVDPALGDNGLAMALTSDGSGDVLGDIFISTRPTVGAAWSVPMPITELDTTALESAGSLRDGASVLFFARETTKFDIYVAKRESMTSAFAGVSMVANINSAQLDFDPWVSADMRTLYFASDRTGNMEIFEATR
jgi:hypothetical protein